MTQNLTIFLKPSLTKTFFFSRFGSKIDVQSGDVLKRLISLHWEN